MKAKIIPKQSRLRLGSRLTANMERFNFEEDDDIESEDEHDIQAGNENDPAVPP